MTHFISTESKMGCGMRASSICDTAQLKDIQKRYKLFFNEEDWLIDFKEFIILQKPLSQTFKTSIKPS
jgi:hypothetical protein